MSSPDLTTVQTDNNEVRYFEELENHIKSMSLKFQEKSVIKQCTYNDIIKCLLSPKGSLPDLCTSKFSHWAKRHFVLDKIAGVDIACSHDTISHGGRGKTIHELNSHHSWIPRFAVELFLKQCIVCQTRQSLKKPAITQIIISIGVMTRLQIDLIDMRTRPDILNENTVYNWILNCIDHFSKFTWCFPLQNKSATEVASKLRELFCMFGAPRLLHSDNGREFVADVIFELKILFPDMLFIRGRPRHPQSQGCIERANGVLTSALGKWMAVNNSSHWSDGLLPVAYGINTRLSIVTKTTPYQFMFGQEPRSHSEYWKIVHESGISNEESLPTSVASAKTDVVNDTMDEICNTTAAAIDNRDDFMDIDIIQLVQRLSDQVVTRVLIDQPILDPSTVDQ
ncbi:unnamed protein product, partial [Adineta ricciae]